MNVLRWAQIKYMVYRDLGYFSSISLTLPSTLHWSSKQLSSGSPVDRCGLTQASKARFFKVSGVWGSEFRVVRP